MSRSARQSSYDIQGAINALGSAGGKICIPSGVYNLPTSLILPPLVSLVGDGQGATILNVNAEIPAIIAASPSGNYASFGRIADLDVIGNSVGTVGINFSWRQHFVVERVHVQGFTQQGILVQNCLMSCFDNVRVQGCGGPGFEQFGVDTGTTFNWRQSRIGICNSGCPVGLAIDRMQSFNITGGAIESCPVSIQIAGKPESRQYCSAGYIFLDMEAPTQDYVEMGYGWTGTTSAVYNVTMKNCQLVPSGQSPSLGVKLNHTYSCRIENCTIQTKPNGTAIVWLENNNTAFSMSTNVINAPTPYLVIGGVVNPILPTQQYSQS